MASGCVTPPSPDWVTTTLPRACGAAADVAEALADAADAAAAAAAKPKLKKMTVTSQKKIIPPERTAMSDKDVVSVGRSQHF